MKKITPLWHPYEFDVRIFFKIIIIIIIIIILGCLLGEFLISKKREFAI
jgi:uncharacterized alpha/beta hydrolase family protein